MNEEATRPGDLICVVDDDISFRAAITRLLQLRGYRVLEYGSADQFLSDFREGIDPDCILLDMRLPGLSGPDLQDRLSQLDAPPPIVFLTGFGDLPSAVRAIKAGAEDVLTKPVSEQALISGIEHALASSKAQQGKRKWLHEARSLLSALTPREREVFEHVVRGRTNKQAAHCLGITERTIKAHRQRIFEKFHAKTVADLVSIAERLGLLA